MSSSMVLNRRLFLANSLAASVAAPCICLGGDAKGDRSFKLDKQVGVTTSSLSGHLVAKPGKGQFSLLDLPRILRDELDMRVIDLNTSSLASEEPGQPST